MPRLADRLARVKPSATMSFTERARALRNEGRDVISLSAGEPDFNTPEHIIQAAKDALDQGKTRYTPVAGIPELRRAVAEESTRARGVPCSEEQTIVGGGAKHILYEFFCAVLNPGDEVIIPAPFWVSYPDQVVLAGGIPVIATGNPDAGGHLDVESLQNCLSSKSKVLVINTPCNPSGTVYSKEKLTALVQVALDAGLYVLCDEVYKELVYGDAVHTSPLSVVNESERDQVFVVDGVSKSYAMTGFRIGYGIGHPDLIAAIAKIQGQSTSNPSSPAQYAALAALKGPKAFLDDWRSEYQSRRDLMVQALKAMPGIDCPLPDGAFYVMPCVKEIIHNNHSVKDDFELTTLLLEKALVAGVPGSPFGAPGHIRFSYATSAHLIESAMGRMARLLESLF